MADSHLLLPTVGLIAPRGLCDLKSGRFAPKRTRTARIRAFTVQRETSVLSPRECLESDLTLDLLELRLTNARDSNQIFEAIETTVGLAELNDPLCQHRADSPNALKFTRVSLVDVHQDLLLGRLFRRRSSLQSLGDPENGGPHQTGG